MPSKLSAINYLKGMQAYYRQCLNLSPRRSDSEVLTLTLEEVKKREEQSVHQGEHIKEGHFRYPARLEKLRWEQTRSIIQRVSPGMDEDPVYLEVLARHAASIEIVLCHKDTDSPNPKALALCEAILLGTIGVLPPYSAMEYKEDWDQYLVVLSYGLLVFIYKAAKAVFLSWQQEKSARPGSTFVIHPDVKKTSSEFLYNTLYAYIFKGYQSTDFDDHPPAEYESHLGLCVACAERFLIAHEYGHSLFRRWGKYEPSWQVTPSWQEEFASDSFGFINTIESAGRLDSIAPNVAFTGALFSLSCLDILYKTLDLVQEGKLRPDEGTKTHPPNQRRISALKAMYSQYIGDNVKYDVPVDRRSGLRKTIDLSINEGILFPGDTLSLLWDSIQHRSLEAHREGRKTNPIWDECFPKLL